MDVRVTIQFSTDDDVTLDAVGAILDNALPYMVDNVDIKWQVED